MNSFVEHLAVKASKGIFRVPSSIEKRKKLEFDLFIKEKESKDLNKKILEQEDKIRDLKLEKYEKFKHRILI